MTRRRIAVGLLALGLGAGGPVRAAEQPLEPATVRTLSLEALGDIPVVSVVSARREPVTEAPGTVHVITAQQIRARGYRDLTDVFQDLPGVDLAAFNRQTVPTEVIVRGVNAAYNKIVVLRDGVPINLPATFPKFGRNLPLHDIERIEVLYGPASVVYGSDAAAAVIQLVSKAPAPGLHVDADVSAGSYDPLHGFDRTLGDGHVSVSWRREAWALRGSVRTFQSEGPDLLELYPNDYAPLASSSASAAGRFEAPMRGWNVDAMLRWHDLEAGVAWTDHTWPSSLAQNPAPPGSYAMTDDSIFRYRFVQPYARHTLRRGQVDLQTVATYGDMTTDPESILVVAGKPNYQFQHQSSLRLDHRTTWTVRDWLTLTGGLRLQTFDVVPAAFFLPTPVTTGSTNLAEHGLGHVVYGRQGAFALVDVEPRPGLKLTAGASYEHDGKSGEHVVLPRGGVVRRLFNGAGHIKLLYGEGFESAIPDLQFLSSKTATLITFPNPDLTSERIRSLELRYEHRMKRLLRAEIGAFYNRVTDLQQIVNLGPATVDGVAYPTSFQNRNFGLIWTAGGEAGAQVAVADDVQIGASYALLFGEETLPEAPSVARTFDMAKVARHKVLAEVTARPLWRLNVNARLRWVGDVATRASNARFHGQPMPGYTNLDLNLRAEDVLPGLDAHLLVENLTDARYYHFGFSGETATVLPRVPQPGLRFLAGLTYRR